MCHLAGPKGLLVQNVCSASVSGSLLWDDDAVVPLLQVLKLMNEPSAAAYAYGATDMDSEQRDRHMLVGASAQHADHAHIPTKYTSAGAPACSNLPTCLAMQHCTSILCRSLTWAAARSTWHCCTSLLSVPMVSQVCYEAPTAVWTGGFAVCTKPRTIMTSGIVFSSWWL